MVNQSSPATRHFNSRKELDLFLGNALAPVVVTVLPDGEKGDLWEGHLELANTGRRTPLHFWHSNVASLAKGLGLTTEEGGIVIARPPR